MQEQPHLCKVLDVGSVENPVYRKAIAITPQLWDLCKSERMFKSGRTQLLGVRYVQNIMQKTMKYTYGSYSYCRWVVLALTLLYITLCALKKPFYTGFQKSVVLNNLIMSLLVSSSESKVHILCSGSLGMLCTNKLKMRKNIL